jgi:DNA-directed RNA polymerase sigma subunit (sigma70/sigma32)
VTEKRLPDPGTDEFIAWLETIPDSAQPEAVKDAMEELQTRIRRIAEARSALMKRDYRGSYDELAQGYGLSRQRAHQIVAASASKPPRKRKEKGSK